MADISLCRLTVSSRDSIALVSGLVADAADLLGLGIADRTRLRTLAQEVVDAIVADAFEPDEDVDLDLEVVRTAGGFRLVLRDRGAPIEFAKTGYPPRVSDLIRLGFADDLQFAHEGRQGNRTEISKRLTYASVATDEEFTAAVAAEPVGEVAVGPDGQAVLDIRPMTPDDVVGVARLFYRCYGYSASNVSIAYEPARLAEYVAEGRHLATIAVTASGRIVGHLSSEVNDPEAITGKIGMLAVDPAFRGHHVATRVGIVHLQRLIALGFVGQFSEAVTVHVGSQRPALKSGGHEVGLMLAAQSSDLDFRGFDQTDGHRKSVLLFYGGFGQTPQRTVYVPPTYRDLIERIYVNARLPREIRSEYERGSGADSATTQFNLRLQHDTGVAWIKVVSYGEDFVAALQQQMSQLQLNRYDLILVTFPLGDSGTSRYAAGLQELGLSLCGVYPEYDHGDVLVLQALNNVEIDPDEIRTASDMGAFLRDAVVADYRRAADRLAQRSRSRAHMARIYEALQ